MVEKRKRGPKPGSGEHYGRLEIRLPDETRARFIALAESKGKTAAQMLRQFIDRTLRRAGR